MDEKDGIKFINIDDNNCDIYKNINDILDDEKLGNYVGDSEYFIEYLLGKINNRYTISLIDNIKKKLN